MISVTIHQPDFDLGDHWDDLVARAQPNVFMSPAALQVAHATMFSKVYLLLAWDQRAEPRRLIGLWAVQKRRTFALWPDILDALPFEYAFLSSPVVDPDFAARVMPAFVDAIADAPNLPRVIALKSFDGEAASYRPLMRAIDARGGRALTLKTENRPILWKDNAAKPSAERRKKLRQSWKRLSALGTTEIVFAREPVAVAAAFEVFLDLEFKSWKGRAGTALLCNDTDASFVRRLIAQLAERRQAAIETLQLDGRIIAAQVLMFSGSMAYTWKTAFDSDYAKFSPGVILIDKLTEVLFAETDLVGIDSCAAEASFMGQIWSARRAMVDMLVDVGPGASTTFRLEAAWQLGREGLKRARDRIRTTLQAARLRKPVLVPSPSSGGAAISGQ